MSMRGWMPWLVVVALLITSVIGGSSSAHGHVFASDALSSAASPTAADHAHLTDCDGEADGAGGEHRPPPQVCEPENCCPGELAEGLSASGSPGLRAHDPLTSGGAAAHHHVPADRPPRLS
jgi:hypothetical protein